MMKFPHEEGKSGMSLKKYEAFVRTVELGSLTKAAEAMGSTQSRISHVLSALEEEYGFVLLRRNRSGVRLTEAGEMVLPKMQEILQKDRGHPQCRRPNRPAGSLYQRGSPLAAWDDPDVPERPPQG